MKRVLGWFLLLELVFGCAHGVVPAPARAGDRNARPVRRVLWVSSRSAWEASRWYRTDRDSGEWPRRVVLAVDGSVCPMDVRDVREPRQWDYWSCPTTWRTPR